MHICPVVPYEFASGGLIGSISRWRLRSAMEDLHKKTCIRWVARDPRIHPDYVQIAAAGDIFSSIFVGRCRADIGRVGGQQTLNLDVGCIGGTMLHEMCHAIGIVSPMPCLLDKG